MRDADVNRLYLLLCCAEKLALHPKLKALAAEINAELEEMANPQDAEEEEEEEVSDERRA